MLIKLGSKYILYFLLLLLFVVSLATSLEAPSLTYSLIHFPSFSIIQTNKEKKNLLLQVFNTRFIKYVVLCENQHENVLIM